MLVLAAVSVTLTGVALVILLQLLGVNVARQLWYLASGLFGPTRIGIWQPDAQFGWVHIPNSTGRHYKPLVYDVTYRIDAEGHRVTSGSYSLPKVLILGDSFTFGQGVEDSSPYPEVLQGSFPDYKIINGGVSAWGTVQAYLELRQQLASHDDVRAVVYAFIDADLERNYLRRTWLEHISKS